MKTETVSAEMLWIAFGEGNEHAFEAIYNRFANSLLQYGLTLTPNTELLRDILQDLFLELWRNRRKSRKVDNVKAYLLKAYRYKLFHSLKKSIKLSILDMKIDDVEMNREESWIITETLDRRIFILRNQIDLLPERQKEIIHLKFFQALKISDIAILLDIRKQSASNLLSRALINLRDLYEKKYSVK